MNRKSIWTLGLVTAVTAILVVACGGAAATTAPQRLFPLQSHFR